MASTDILLLWSDHAALSVTIWLAIAIVLFYLARGPAHRAIRSLGVVLRSSLRFAAKAISGAEQKLTERNREVLLETGKQASQRLLEREFHRVNAVVTRDLGAFPALNRRLSEQINKMDQDYQQASEEPPAPPSWTNAVSAMVKLRSDDETMVGNVLGHIKTAAENQHRTAMDEYRKANRVRHGLLRGMMPYWRKVSQSLQDVSKSIFGLEERSRIIDNEMRRYEEIVAGTSQAERSLAASAMTQFFIAGTVLLVAVIGGVVNFYLIALPMSEMVGGNSVLGPFKTSSIAALVIIMLEIAMGLFLMESLRITRMFPVIGALDDQMRKRMIWMTFTILLILAGVESSLAYMRDLLAADREALRQTLAGIQATNPEFRWIPSLGQMVMGFILPFALTFVAIPLESFIHSSRTVGGSTLAAMLRGLSITLRMIGNSTYHFSNMLAHVYDLLIFIPLRLEDMFRNRKAESHDVAVKSDAGKSLTEIEEVRL